MKRTNTIILMIFVMTMLSKSLLAIDLKEGQFQCGGLFYNKLSDSEVEVTRVSGYYYDAYEYIIPEEVTDNSSNKYKVTAIGEFAFHQELSQYRSALHRITIPNSVTTIRRNAFQNNRGLRIVTMGNGIDTIEKDAFDQCDQLEQVNISNLEAWCRINFQDFKSNPLYKAHHLYLNGEEITNLVIPDGISSIKPYSFISASSLVTINIPNSVKEIGVGGFRDCSSIESIIIPSSITKMDMGSFANWTSLKRVDIYDLEAWCNINFVGEDSNPLKYAHQLYLDNSLLTDLVFPTNITEVRNYVFNGCSSLKTVVLHDQIKKIGERSFRECTGIISIDMPSSIKEIGLGAFKSNTGLSSITIPSTIEKIGYEAFDGCTGLNRVDIQDLEAWCKIDFVSEGSNPLKYAHQLYLRNDLVTDLTIPAGITEIRESTFYGLHSLKTIAFNDQITKIGEQSFMECTGIVSIDIPSNVRVIDNSAFQGCTKLSSLKIANGTEQIGVTAFAGCSGLKDIYIDCSKIEVSFSNLPSIENVFLGNNVSVIDTKAFSNCTGLKTISFGSGIKTIGANAFEGCTALEKVNINDIKAWCEASRDEALSNPLCIAHTLYINDELINKLVIPDEITKISRHAFQGCTSISSVVLGRNVNVLENYAFYQCSALASVYILSKTVPNWDFGTSPEAMSTFDNWNFLNTTLYVPHGKVKTYQDDVCWRFFRNIQEKPHDEFDDPIKLIANNFTREYGDENPSFTFEVIGEYLDGTPNITCYATADSPIGEYLIEITKGNVKNCNDTYVNGILTITKAPLTVSVNNYIREQGQENPPFTINYEGWKLGETESVLITVPKATTTAIKDSPAGDYPITVAGGEAQNYDLEYIGGTLTITAASRIDNTLTNNQSFDVYTTTGIRIKCNATSFKDLPFGVYIINNKKVLVK